MAFDWGAAGGGATNALQEIIKQKLLEQVQRHQMMMAEQRLTEDARQANMTNTLGRDRLGHDRDELGERKRQFDTEQPILGRLRTAQAADLERKPQAEAANRAHDFELAGMQGGLRLREIDEQGRNAANVARIRIRPRVQKVSTVGVDGKPVTRFIDIDTGATIHEEVAAPTSDERNRQAASGRAAGVLQAISDLSERINVNQGAAAKIIGAAERAKAEANLNDDVSEYEAVVSGFTPLLARAVGHSGVLTEQDVQSVRKMLPQPTDSKSVRDRKVQRINALMGDLSGAGTGSGSGGGGGNALDILNARRRGQR